MVADRSRRQVERLGQLGDRRVVAAGGRFVLGHTKRDTLELVSPWKEVKMLKHGDTVMRFLEIS